MSTPPLPKGLANTRLNRVANVLHSAAIHLLRRARRDDRASGLTPERLSLLSILVFGGPRTASELAEYEQVSRPAISRILNALEGQGLLERQRLDADRRVQMVYPTPSGKRLIEAGRERRVRRIAAELQSLTPGELAALDAATVVLESLDQRALADA